MKKEEQKVFSSFDSRRQAFSTAKTLDDACEIVWPNTSHYCHHYQHYTTLGNVLTKILKREWWLTRSDNVRLNDLQEAKKFGNPKVLKRTYQTSFTVGTNESAAMWGLYAKGDPLAVKILISREAIDNWMANISFCDKSMNAKNKIEWKCFRDVIYASVPFLDADKQRDAYDKNRGNRIFWGDVSACFANKSSRDELARKLREDRFSGWVKDAEWRHEHESRLCVRLEKMSSRKALPIRIPDKVIDSMSFTLSPWLDRTLEKEISDIIKGACSVQGIKLRKDKIHRSTLSGALNLS